jgi:hypothetical protein
VWIEDGKIDCVVEHIEALRAELPIDVWASRSWRVSAAGHGEPSPKWSFHRSFARTG